MRGKTHMAVSLAVSSFVLPVTQENVIAPVLLLAGSIAGALFVDIDTPHSKIGHKHKVISTILTLTAGHRGIFHSPFFCVLFCMIMGLPIIFMSSMAENYYLHFAFGFFMGWMLHIWADSFTNSGVPWLYPFSKKHCGFKICKSCGLADTVLGAGCFLIGVTRYGTAISRILF